MRKTQTNLKILGEIYVFQVLIVLFAEVLVVVIFHATVHSSADIGETQVDYVFQVLTVLFAEVLVVVIFPATAHSSVDIGETQVEDVTLGLLCCPIDLDLVHVPRVLGVCFFSLFPS